MSSVPQITQLYFVSSQVESNAILDFVVADSIQCIYMVSLQAYKQIALLIYACVYAPRNKVNTHDYCQL